MFPLSRPSPAVRTPVRRRPPHASAARRRARIATVLSLTAIAAVVTTGCGGAASPPANGPFHAGSQLPAGLAGRAAPSFSLEDARGGRLRNADVAGRPYAVTFLYANCPDVCPLIGQQIRLALEQLGSRARELSIVGISVDPRNDDAETVRSWLEHMHEPANFHYLVGSERELAPVWKSYFAAPQIPGDPRSAHTAVVWLVDADGRLAAKLDAGTGFDPDVLAHDLGVLLDRAKRSR